MNKHYFPHDYHARQDPKISALINDFGYEGYGIYLALMEIMHEQGGKMKKFPGLFSGLAFELRLDEKNLTKQIEAMLQAHELLLQDEKYIWSNRVLKNLEEINTKYEAKSNAGRLGGLKSAKIKKEKLKQLL